MLPEVDNKYIAQKIISTNFSSSKEVISYFTKSNMYYLYLEIIEAYDIEFTPKINKNEIVTFPQKVSYKNYPKIDFFPYKLPKTQVEQLWYKKDKVFIAEIKANYVDLKVSILPFKENGIKLLIIAEIIKKEIFVPLKILNFILNDFERIFNIVSETIKK